MRAPPWRVGTQRAKVGMLLSSSFGTGLQVLLGIDVTCTPTIPRMRRIPGVARAQFTQPRRCSVRLTPGGRGNSAWTTNCTVEAKVPSGVISPPGERQDSVFRRQRAAWNLSFRLVFGVSHRRCGASPIRIRHVPCEIHVHLALSSLLLRQSVEFDVSFT
jgi:hypothetical protein